MTRLIVDSTCDLPEAQRTQFSIAVLPLSVTLEGRSYRDGVEIDLDRVYAAIRAGAALGTSQIRYEDTRALFEETLRAGDDALYLAFSSAMSGTMGLAAMVAEELLPQYPGRRIEIVDSRGGSMGSGLIAYQLGLMRDGGADLDTLVERAKWMAQHTKYAFTVDDFSYAMKGGRVIARAAGTVGDILKIKPVMDVRDGMLHLVRFVGGSRRALAAVADRVADYAKNFKDQLIGVTHGDDAERAKAMLRLLKERLPDCTVLTQRIGSVLGSHLGTGGVGVFCLDQRPGGYSK